MEAVILIGTDTIPAVDEESIPAFLCFQALQAENRACIFANSVSFRFECDKGLLFAFDFSLRILRSDKRRPIHF